jgi:hypothetical protein
LTLAVLPTGVTTVAASTFKGCSSLAEVSIPYEATSIGADAFKGCRALAKLTLPAGISQIGDGAFDGAGPLATLVVIGSRLDEAVVANLRPCLARGAEVFGPGLVGQHFGTLGKKIRDVDS